jgi:hypothetical protein
VDLQSLSACTLGRIEVNSHRQKRYLDVLSILRELSFRERPPQPAVGILVRDDNLETGREIEKKGGNDLKQLGVQTKALVQLLIQRDHPSRQDSG